MKSNSGTTPALYIGLDVHKEKTSVAIVDPGTNGFIIFLGRFNGARRSVDGLERDAPVTWV